MLHHMLILVLEPAGPLTPADSESHSSPSPTQQSYQHRTTQAERSSIIYSNKSFRDTCSAFCNPVVLHLDHLVSSPGEPATVTAAESELMDLGCNQSIRTCISSRTDTCQCADKVENHWFPASQREFTPVPHPTAWLRQNNLRQNAKNFNQLDNGRTEIRLQVS